jgi:hypothetical protein
MKCCATIKTPFATFDACGLDFFIVAMGTVDDDAISLGT